MLAHWLLVFETALKGDHRVRLAIVLFNLGGPDSAAAVRPFLFNLFNDAAILRVPGVVRWLLAQVISRRRAPIAQEIYAHLGGGSPLLPNTLAQAEALKQRLLAQMPAGTEILCVPAMRYWHPFAVETAAEVRSFNPDRVVLLPLYPQFSTTTTASSLKDWDKHAQLEAPSTVVCCYPFNDGFALAAAELIKQSLENIRASGHTPRLLLSAHGLPKKIVEGGDPYAWQVEQTAAKVIAKLDEPDLDWQVCYQSRVGPLEWIGPSTDTEIDRAGKDKRAIAIFPVAFVSEHSETLVEIEIEYREKAHEAGVPMFERVPAVSVAPAFIDGLSKVVLEALNPRERVCPEGGKRLCGMAMGGCPAAR
jgi:ferrochelatase